MRRNWLDSKGLWMENGLFYLLLYSLLLFILFPLLWMILTSLKSEVETFRVPLTWFPEKVYVKTYFDMWKYQPFGLYFYNSFVVASGTTVLATVLGCLAGYGFSRFQFPGRQTLLLTFLTSRMLPAILLIIPFFKLMVKAGLYNSHTGLIIAYTSFALPISTWLALGFFESVPKELDESAMIDGCTRLGMLFKVIAPVISPGLVAIVIFCWIQAWNEYLFALCLSTTQRMYTIPIGIAALFGEYKVAWNQLMSAASISILPVVIMFAFIQRYLVDGLASGAVKG
jgi:multiple sugar transport system permease protein